MSPRNGSGSSEQRRTVGRSARSSGWRGPSPAGSKTRCRSASKASSIASRSSVCAGSSPRWRASAPPGRDRRRRCRRQGVRSRTRPSDRHARRAAGRTGPRGSSRPRPCRAWRVRRRPGAPAGYASPRTARCGDGIYTSELEIFRHCRHISRSTLLTQNISFRTRRPLFPVRRTAYGRCSQAVWPHLPRISTGTAYVVQRPVIRPGVARMTTTSHSAPTFPVRKEIDVIRREEILPGMWRGHARRPCSGHAAASAGVLRRRPLPGRASLRGATSRSPARTP